MCEIFGVSADELLQDKKKVSKTEKQEVTQKPVAKFKFKMVLTTTAVILIILFVLYILYAIYKFCILSYISNKVKKYENLDNYYCRIVEYGDNDLKEDTKVWYKDGIYKIERKIKVKDGFNNYIDYINTYSKIKKEYINENKNANEFEIEKYINNYQNGNYLFSNFPEEIKSKNNLVLKSIIKLDKCYLEKSEKISTLHLKDCIIQFNSNTFLPISYTDTISDKSVKEGFIQTIKYYEIKLNSVKEEDIQEPME